MAKKILFLPVFLCCFFAAFAQQIKSPAEFLGYKLGDKFTYHYRIAEYFRYVASISKNVKLVQYGATNEGRPLLAMFIASDDNIGKLEEIRQNNMRLAGLEPGTAAVVAANTPAICWLSYNVHGNEPASSEAAMQTLFDMVDPSNTRTQGWLKNTVVVIDPCLNPDGRDRYVNFYNSVRGETPDVTPSAREHVEPWPGGRVNHFYFDLNRDWAWQTQKETQARVALFNQWLPQVHVDYHEQGYNAPYYFAPAAEPYHKNITAWQREFQVTIGKNNAKYFDQNGWMYFTKQEFDLLYPSYGDTYPIYNGSIGMTYEQGGISAGLGVITRSGDTLTFAQRIRHHHSTSLSTVETVSANATKLVTEFKKFFDNSAANPPGEYKTYVIKNDNDDKINKLGEVLTRNGIKYSFGLNQSVTGFSYLSGKTETYSAKPGDLVVNAYQPKSVLLNVLLEPKTFVADSNTYDITAWSLPYAYGLEAYALKESVKPSSAKVPNATITAPPATVAPHAYAYVSAWQSLNDVKFLAALMKAHIKVRYSEKAFESAGKKFAAGSLLITRAGNDRDDFDKTVTDIATGLNHKVVALSSGFVDKGDDLGSSDIKYIRQPRVLLFTGDGVNSEAMGEVWHLFEQQIGYPITLSRYQDIGRIRLADFDVAIFPDGNYDDFPSDKLQSWVRDGGKLIAIDGAVEQLVDKKSFSIKKKDEKKEDKDSKKNEIRVFGNRERDAIRGTIPGAIFKVNLDNTHPLAFGLSTAYFDLKLNDDIYELLGDDGWNVGTIKKDAYVAGFAGQKSRDKIKDGLLMGVQNMGRGSVIYLADDPLFRSFWENGKLLFSNAVFMVGN